MCEDRCTVQCGLVPHLGGKNQVDSSTICKPITASGIDILVLLTGGLMESGV